MSLAQADDKPFELIISHENDDLLFGLYGLINNAGDGNDYGRTHGLTISISRDVVPRVRIGLSAETLLFTQRVAGLPNTDAGARPIHFNEQNRLTVQLDVNDRKRDEFAYHVEAGAVIANHESVSVGGTGQQNAWHGLLRETVKPGMYFFDYVPDGQGVDVGAVARAEGRMNLPLVHGSVAALTLMAMAAGEFETLPGGSEADFAAGLRARFGDARKFHVEVVVSQEAQVYLEQLDVAGITRAKLRLIDKTGVEFWLGLDFYEGSPNHRYNTYNFNNTVMRAGFVTRF